MSRALFAANAFWGIDSRGRLRRTCAETATSISVRQNSPPSTTLVHWPTAERVLVGDAEGVVRAYDSSTGALLHEGHAAVKERITALHIVEHAGALFVGIDSGTIIRLNLRTLEFFALLGEEGMGHDDAVLSFVSNSEYLFSGGADSSIFVWETENNSGVREISMPAAPVTSLLFLDRCLWVGGADGSIEVLEIYGEDSDGVSSKLRQRAHAGPVTMLQRVGQNEVWSAPGISEHMDRARRRVESIAVWDTRACTLLRRESPFPREGLAALLVKQRLPSERVTIALVDGNLMRTELVRKMDGTLISGHDADKEEAPADIIAVKDNQIEQMHEELVRLREQCGIRVKDVSGSVPAANSQQKLKASNAVGLSDIFDDLSLFETQDSLPSLAPASDIHSSISEFPKLHESLYQVLKRAEDITSTLLTSSLSESDVNAQLSRRPKADWHGITRIADLVAAAVNLLELSKPDYEHPVSDIFDISSVVLSSAPFSEETDRTGRDSSAANSTRSPSAQENPKSQIRDISVIAQERDVLANELEVTRKEYEVTISSFEETINNCEKKAAILEKDVARLQLENSSLKESNDLLRSRCEELDLLLTQQVSHLKTMMSGFEPKMKDHVEHATKKLDQNEKQLGKYRKALKDAESKIASSEKIREQLELEKMNLETSLEALKYEEDETRKELTLLRQDNEDCLQEIAILRSAATTHDSELKHWRSAANNLKLAVNEMKGDIEQYEEDAAQYEEERLKREEDLKIREAKVRELALERDEFSHLVDELKIEVGMRDDKLRERGQELIDLLVERNELDKSLRDLRNSAPVSESICPRCCEDGNGEFIPQVGSRTQDCEIITSFWEIQGSRNDSELRNALEAATESTRASHKVLRELASTVEEYKRAAAFHAEFHASVSTVINKALPLTKLNSIRGSQFRSIVGAVQKAVCRSEKFLVNNTSSLPVPGTAVETPRKSHDVINN